MGPQAAGELMIECCGKKRISNFCPGCGKCLFVANAVYVEWDFAECTEDTTLLVLKCGHKLDMSGIRANEVPNLVHCPECAAVRDSATLTNN